MIAAAIFAATLSSGAIAPENPLAWMERKTCRKAGSEYVMSQRDLVAALLAEYPLVVDVEALSGTVPKLPEAIANIACSECKPGHQASLLALREAARDLLSNRQSRKFTLRLVSGRQEPGPIPGTTDVSNAQIIALYDLSQPATYEVLCVGYTAPPESPPVPTPVPFDGQLRKGYLQSIKIASTLAETEKPFDKREAASVSLRADREAGTEVGTVKGIILFPPLFNTPQDGTNYAFYSLQGFLGYERLTAEDPAKEVNNVDVGLRSLWLFNRASEAITPVSLDVYWQTDDQTDSSLLRVETGVRPWLGRAIAETGYGYNKPISPVEGDYFWTFNWDVRLIADYADVGDPGQKAALLKHNNYGRLGYDLTGAWVYARREKDASYGLSFQYQFRDDWMDTGANADLFSAKLKFYPSKTSNFVFGIEYNRGENLSSLEPLENWLLTFGYRQ